MLLASFLARRTPLGAVASVAALALAVLTAPAAHAQAQLTFSGGSGTPLTINILSPITYVVTAPSGVAATSFVFDAVGSVPLEFGFATGINTITYTVNGGAAQTTRIVTRGNTTGDITRDDLYINDGPRNLSVGDIVVLSSGTLTTNTPLAGAAPASALTR